MTARDDSRNYEIRQKANGFKRKAVRLPADAAEQLEELAWRNRMTESEVVSRLLLGLPLKSQDPANPYGLSESERAFAREMGIPA